MSTLIRVLVLGLVAAFAGPAAAQAPLAQAPSAPAPVPPQSAPRDAPVLFGLRFPDSVAGFPRGNVVDFEKDRPGLGYAVKYGANGWAIDVYIYDAGLKNIPDSPTAELVVRQFLGARSEIFKRQQVSNGQVEEKGTFRISTRDKKVRFICGTYLIANDGRQIDSFLCLTTWRGKFVKYRLSTRHQADSTAVAKRFVAGWIELLWPASANKRAMLGAAL